MGEYVEVGGLKTWLDSWGSGPPLVLLHGGLVTNATWGQMAPGLAEHFRVLAPERRGHGHTPDVEGPFTYALMAEDTIAFLEEVVGGPAHLVGWSDGGNIGLIVAFKRPDLVTKLVPISANFNAEGTEAEILEGFEEASGEGAEFAFMRGLYEEASPDGPGHWPIVFEKIKRMGLDYDPPITVEDLGKITSPTLVMASDDDIVTMEHTVEMYRSIPNSQLAIVPGTSHVLVMEKPDEVNRLILEFLRKDAQPTRWPVRRARAG
jgi:pimeloyl-ACP methyl ester carboxylesterase